MNLTTPDDVKALMASSKSEPATFTNMNRLTYILALAAVAAHIAAAVWVLTQQP